MKNNIMAKNRRRRVGVQQQKRQQQKRQQPRQKRQQIRKPQRSEGDWGIGFVSGLAIGGLSALSLGMWGPVIPIAGGLLTEFASSMTKNKKFGNGAFWGGVTSAPIAVLTSLLSGGTVVLAPSPSAQQASPPPTSGVILPAGLPAGMPLTLYVTPPGGSLTVSAPQPVAGQRQLEISDFVRQSSGEKMAAPFGSLVEIVAPGRLPAVVGDFDGLLDASRLSMDSTGKPFTVIIIDARFTGESRSDSSALLDHRAQLWGALSRSLRGQGNEFATMYRVPLEIGDWPRGAQRTPYQFFEADDVTYRGDKHDLPPEAFWTDLALVAEDPGIIQRDIVVRLIVLTHPLLNMPKLTDALPGYARLRDRVKAGLLQMDFVTFKSLTPDWFADLYPTGFHWVSPSTTREQLNQIARQLVSPS